MRWREIRESMGATTSGSIATVSAPIGGIQRRVDGGNFFTGVPVNSADPTPNTPYKKRKKKRVS